MNDVAKIGKAVVVTGTKAVLSGIGMFVLGYVFSGGSLKDLSVDELLKGEVEDEKGN